MTCLSDVILLSYKIQIKYYLPTETCLKNHVSSFFFFKSDSVLLLPLLYQHYISKAYTQQHSIFSRSTPFAAITAFDLFRANTKKAMAFREEAAAEEDVKVKAVDQARSRYQAKICKQDSTLAPMMVVVMLLSSCSSVNLVQVGSSQKNSQRVENRIE